MIYITEQRCRGEDGLNMCRVQQVKPQTAKTPGLTNPQSLPLLLRADEVIQ
jgi:hypothetical protein